MRAFLRFAFAYAFAHVLVIAGGVIMTLASLLLMAIASCLSSGWVGGVR